MVGWEMQRRGAVLPEPCAMPLTPSELRPAQPSAGPQTWRLLIPRGPVEERCWHPKRKPSEARRLASFLHFTARKGANQAS